MNAEQGMSNDEVNSQNQNKRKFDLEERQIIFAILIMNVSENLHTTPAGRYFSGQVVPSGTFSCITLCGSTKCRVKGRFCSQIESFTERVRRI